MDYIIRKGTLADIDQITSLEKLCFSKEEAASRESFVERLNIYSNHFILIEKNHEIICVVNGFVTDSENLLDEMYVHANDHNENGKWQMIFGVETHPDYQGKGFASKALKAFIELSAKEGRKGLVLTCKENLIPFYEKFGFENEGISESKHGGETWYQMRLRIL